jgi:hypothetical protein
MTADEVSTGSGSDRVIVSPKDPVAIAPGTDITFDGSERTL